MIFFTILLWVITLLSKVEFFLLPNIITVSRGVRLDPSFPQNRGTPEIGRKVKIKPDLGMLRDDPWQNYANSQDDDYS